MDLHLIQLPSLTIHQCTTHTRGPNVEYQQSQRITPFCHGALFTRRSRTALPHRSLGWTPARLVIHPVRIVDSWQDRHRCRLHRMYSPPASTGSKAGAVPRPGYLRTHRGSHRRFRCRSHGGRATALDVHKYTDMFQPHPNARF